MVRRSCFAAGVRSLLGGDAQGALTGCDEGVVPMMM